MSDTQHCITTMVAPSWKCLPVVDGDPEGQTLSDSSGSASGAVNQEDQGLSSLLKQENHEVQDAYLQLFTKVDVALKEMKPLSHRLISESGPICMPLHGCLGGSCPITLAASSGPGIHAQVPGPPPHCDTQTVCRLGQVPLGVGHPPMSSEGCSILRGLRLPGERLGN